MLDIECFSFLNKSIESELSPIIIMASNRGVTKIRGTNIKSPHGIPIDFLDRMLIISTKKYSDDEIEQILKIRCDEEDVQFTDKALKLLTKIGNETSLRYAIQLIMTSDLCAKKRKATKVDLVDIKKVFGLFSDIKRSTGFFFINLKIEFLKSYQDQFILSEENNEKKEDKMNEE
jgi:RuvB-like protein 2